MSNELVTVEPAKVPDVFVAGGLDPYIEKIRSHVTTIVPDISTDKGRKEIASMAYKVARSKSYLDTIGKDYVASLKELPKIVDAERKRMRDTLDTIQDEVRKPLTEWEDREKARVSELERELSEIVEAGNHALNHWQTLPLEAMRERMAEIATCTVDFQEFTARAEEAKLVAITKTKEAIQHREAYDAEQAELTRLRAEQVEREQREREARIAQEAAEKAQHEAEAKAQAEINAANERARQAEQEKQRAIEAERAEAARVMREAEETAKQNAAVEAARQADKKNREKVHAEAFHFIEGILGITKEQAAGVIDAIANNDVPHVSIRY